VIRKPLIC